MTDQINTFENYSGRRISTKIIEGQEVHEGLEGKKMFVYAEIGRNGKARRIPMFMKTQEHRDEEIFSQGIDVDNVLSKHALLKRLDFPVAPTFRIDKKKKRILMTDMTEDGKKEIFDLHNAGDHPNFANALELSSRVKELNKRAFDQGILLTESAFAIIVDPNTNHGNVYLLDLGEVWTRDEFGQRLGDRATPDKINEYFKNTAKDFINHCIY